MRFRLPLPVLFLNSFKPSHKCSDGFVRSNRNNSPLWCELSRRDTISSLTVITLTTTLTSHAIADNNEQQIFGSNGEICGRIFQVSDPSTYSALVYRPTLPEDAPPPPVLIVLPGAAKNQGSVWELADPQGEHAGLPLSLLASGRAPSNLASNFVVISPFSEKRTSFYDEPRSKLLEFVRWACENGEQARAAGCPRVNLKRCFLLGFSDGATVAMELATTKRFRAVVVAAYGFSGRLPSLALQRLANLPVWVFHSADDVIFPVAYSDHLVASLRSVVQAGEDDPKNVIRYTRYAQDQEGFTGAVRGHSTGISASKLPDVYDWMLSFK